MKKIPWTDNEKRILKKYYKVIPMSELIYKLPGRSRNSIYKQVQYLRKRGWTFNEREL